MTIALGKRTRLTLISVLALSMLAATLWAVRTHGGPAMDGDYQVVDLHAIGSIEFDEDHGTEADVPESYRRLDGQKVVIAGEMWLDESGPTANHFQLVDPRHLDSHRRPRVQDRVFAQAPTGKMLPVLAGTVRVYGTLHVRAVRARDNRIMSLYSMVVDRVAEAP